MSTEHTTPPALPPEVREAIEKIFLRRSTIDPHALWARSSDINAVCAALAPLWPRSVAVTEDAEELATAVIREWDRGMQSRELAANALERAAAVLAPLVAELAESQARRAEMLAACKSARDDLRAANNVAENLLAERDRLREEIADLRAQLATVHDATSGAYVVLCNMAARHPAERAKWLFPDEPLRSDAARLLPRLRSALDAARKGGQP